MLAYGECHCLIIFIFVLFSTTICLGSHGLRLTNWKVPYTMRYSVIVVSLIRLSGQQEFFLELWEL